MEVRAYAKINWDLYVLGRRADGFHELDSVFVNVSLSDRLTVETANALVFSCSDPTLPTDDCNLVVKAARVLAEAAGRPPGVRIHLEKAIPAGGGMGGGSSDAAATLRALNQLWELHWPVARLAPLAARLGSDVTYFLTGGWCRCLGRGEIVEALEGAQRWPPLPLLLILPPWHVATPAVYRRLNAGEWDGKSGRRVLTAIREALEFLHVRGSIGEGLANCRPFNSLTEAAVAVDPRLTVVRQILERECAGDWLMSGSGAVHFVIGNQEKKEKLSAELLSRAGPGFRVLNATTVTTLL